MLSLRLAFWGVEFILAADAHTRTRKNWDQALLDMLGAHTTLFCRLHTGSCLTFGHEFRKSDLGMPPLSVTELFGRPACSATLRPSRAAFERGKNARSLSRRSDDVSRCGGKHVKDFSDSKIPNAAVPVVAEACPSDKPVLTTYPLAYTLEEVPVLDAEGKLLGKVGCPGKAILPEEDETRYTHSIQGIQKGIHASGGELKKLRNSVQRRRDV
eukprot:5002300-Pyramimonas_sp.AAC.2